jgi:acyl carrier protein
MSDATEDLIRRFLAENYLFTDDPMALGLDDSLLGRGIVDSTGMLEVILFIEEQWSIKVADQDMVPENLDSVRRISAYVDSRRKGS